MITSKRHYFLLFLVLSSVLDQTTAWCEDVAGVPPILRLKRLNVLGDARLRHAAQLTAIVPLSDGRRILTSSQDNTLRLWDLETGAEIRRFVHKDDVWIAAVRPGDRTCISSGDNKELIEWDLSSGTEVRRFKGHEQTVFRCAVNPAGTRLMSGAGGPDAIEWDLAGSGSVIDKHKVGVKDSSLYGVAWSPDGTQVAFCGTQKQLALFGAADGKCLRKFDGHTNTVFTVQFSPDGQRLVSASEDKTVRMWNVADGKELWKVDLPDDAKIASFSPDGQRVCAGVEDSSVRVLSAADGKELLKIEMEDRQIWPAVFTTNGKQILSGGACTIRRHDALTGQQLFPPANYDGPCTPMESVVLNASTGHLICATEREKVLFVVDTVTGRVVQRWPNEERANRLFCSADGRRLFGWGNKKVVAWDVASGKVLWSKEGDNSARAMASSRDGAAILLMSYDKHIVLSGETGDQIREIRKGERTYFNEITVCPEGRIVACCHNDGSTGLYQLPDLNEVGRFVLPTKMPKPADKDPGRVVAEDSAPRVEHVDIQTGAILPKSGVLLLADREKVLRQWRPVEEPAAKLTEEQIRKTIGDLTSEAFTVRQEAIRKLATCGEEILPLLDKIDVSDDQELGQTLRFLRQSMATRRLPTHLQAQSVAFEGDLRKVKGHPDGFHWAALEGYGPVYVNLGHATSQGMVVLDRLEDPNIPQDIVFSSDGRFLYTVNGNCTVSVYQLSPDRTP